jgi:hypothetical protein
MEDITMAQRAANKIIKPYDYAGDYYDVKYHLNNSMLSVYNDDPKLFFEIFMGRGGPEHSTPAMEFGKLVHCQLLTPDLLKEQYVCDTGCNKPTSVQQKKYCLNRAAGMSKKDAFKKAGYHTAYDDGRVDEIEERLKEYMDSLKNSNGRKLFSTEDRDKLLTIQWSFQTHQGIRDLWDRGEAQYSEFEVRWMHPCGMKCKAKMDRIMVDQTNREITIVDLKTTSDSPKEFVHKTERNFNGTASQLAFYTLALVQKYELRIDAWKFHYYLVYAGSKTGMVYLIKLTENHVRGFLDQNLHALEDTIRDINRQYKTKGEADSKEVDYTVGLEDILEQ